MVNNYIKKEKSSNKQHNFTPQETRKKKKKLSPKLAKGNNKD